MLKDYPKKIVTKDGTQVSLRPVVTGDEEALVSFFSQIPSDEQWFLRERLHEPMFLKKWMSKLDYDHMLSIIAVKDDDNTIIANLTLYRSASPSIRHVVHLRTTVHPKFRGMRLGSWMILDSVKLSMDLGIHKVIAEFVSGVEEAAIAAAQKLDFHEEAALKNYVRARDGSYRDLMIMVKDIHQEWSDF
jgi:L-amino acid N-acyltransferase YncA